MQQEDANEILLMSDVIRLTGFSRTSIYRLIEQANFPKPFKLGLKKLAWKKDWIDAWINRRAVDFLANLTTNK